MEEKKKKRLGAKAKIILLSSLILAMVLTVGLTLAFWHGTGGATMNNDYNFDVGRPGVIQTQIVTVGDPSTGTLIPTGAALLETSDVHEITISIGTTWLAQDAAQASNIPAGTVGTLAVTASGLTLTAAAGSNQVANQAVLDAITDPLTTGGRTATNGGGTETGLFAANIALNPTGGAITAGDTTGVTVSVTITMNWPATAAIRDAIAEASVELALAFVVTV